MITKTSGSLPASVSPEIISNLERYGLRFDESSFQQFATLLGSDGLAGRLNKLNEWLKVAIQNRDGVYLTPLLLTYLNKSADFASLLKELDVLRTKTRAGSFRLNNRIQRDLEFRRFLVQHQKARTPILPVNQLYELFLDLDCLSSQQDVEVPIDLNLRDHLKRAAFEAKGFLKFLQQFQAHTSRPIMLIGNDKAQLAGGGYGRQWVIEPLEKYLDNFGVFYFRVPSHGTMRLTVPSPFHKSFVEKMHDVMPHLIILDGASPSADQNKIRFSKAARGYANWFTVFNDQRGSNGISDSHENTLLPDNHVAELRKWHEYTEAKEQLEDIVGCGDKYQVTLWAPEVTNIALLGETEVVWPSIPLAGDAPLVILANPISYTPSLGLPPFMASTKPYYLDSADRYLREKLEAEIKENYSVWGGADYNSAGPVGGFNPGLSVFGFGPHGLERRVYGPTMERFFRSLQVHIRCELATMLKQ